MTEHKGKGAYTSDVFSDMLFELKGSTLWDTMEALCAGQVINGYRKLSDSEPGTELFIYDIDRDGTDDMGIAVKTEGTDRLFYLIHVSGNSIDGNWSVDVDEALGEDMSDEYYDSLEFCFPLKSVSVTVAPPAAGTVIESDVYWNQTNRPEARPLPKGQLIHEDIFAWWTADLEKSGPFTGTFEEGKEYIAYLQIETVDGRDFDDIVQVTVNGETPVLVEKDEDMTFLLKVFAYVKAVR